MTTGKKALAIVTAIAIPLLIGGISGFITMPEIKGWYAQLNKPSFNPPNYIFGPVWTTLYVLMGVSLYLVWKSPQSRTRNIALGVFGVQLILNFLWSIIFFSFHRPGFAFFDLCAMWLMIAAMIYYFYRLNHTAAFLEVPYLIWVSFAGVLNAAVWMLN